MVYEISVFEVWVIGYVIDYILVLFGFSFLVVDMRLFFLNLKDG